jgi:hypothetical protein
MLDVQKTDNKNLLIIVCEDGSVIIDRRVYEQKLGTLLSCQSKKEVYELAKSCQKYLTEHYGTRISTPMYV